jgi:glycerophosphoryl diester phosphodiesterase
MLLENKIRYNWCFVICILFLFAQCKEKEEYTDDTFSNSKVMVLGHRGMGTMYKMPGNTYQSVAPAVAIGLDGCEVDIQMTKDTVLVLYHDHLLNPATTCNGRIYESDWSDIKQCKYYAWENGIFINSVEDLFNKLPGLANLYFSFDCSKVDTDVEDLNLYKNQYLRAIRRLCNKYNMSNHIFLEGDVDLLQKAQSLGMTNELFLFSYLDNDAINAASINHFFGISTCLDWVKVPVDSAHAKGLYVMVWSPNNLSQNKEVLKAKADIIQTDDPISILKLLNRFNYEYVIP